MSKITETIEKKREEIDAINKELVSLIAKRIGIAKEIGALKKQENIPVQDHEREHLVLTQARTDAALYNIDPSYIEDVFRAIMKGARDVQ